MAFYLVPSDYATLLASTPPSFGQSWSSSTSSTSTSSASVALGDFEQTDWRPLQHVLVHALALHPQRTHDMAAARFCVDAAPQLIRDKLHRPNVSLYTNGPVLQRHLHYKGCNGDWRAACPGRPMVVIDVPDIDYQAWNLCDSLWDRCDVGDPTLLRVAGSPPLYRAHLRRCPLVTVPWLSHTRRPRTALDALRAQPSRDIVIASAFSSSNHGFEAVKGWGGWRRALRNACALIGESARPDAPSSRCVHVYQSMSGNGARQAVELYARSLFCLMPPGDSIVRGAIVDALSVACVPVFFHPAQQQLWPLHWNASEASLLFDWTEPDAERNATAVLLALVAFAEEGRDEARALQQAAARAHQRMVYRRRDSRHSEHEGRPDAVDLLVGSLQSQFAV